MPPVPTSDEQVISTLAAAKNPCNMLPGVLGVGVGPRLGARKRVVQDMAAGMATLPSPLVRTAGDLCQAGNLPPRSAPISTTLLILLTVCSLVVSWSPLLAQQTAADLQVGQRVRLTYPCEPEEPAREESTGRACRAEGSLALMAGDTLVVEGENSASRHDLNDLSRVQVSSGKKSHWLVGAAIGFVVGTGAAYAALSSGGSTGTCDQSANQDAISTGECIALSALVGGFPGAGVGTVVGLFIRSERWRDVPIAGPRVGLRAVPGAGVQLELTISH